MIMAGKGKVRVLVVEDHPGVRAGLVALLNAQPDLAVGAAVADAAAALAELAREAPDLAIVDLGLQDQSGLELMRTMRAQYPGLAIMVLTMHAASMYAGRAFAAGAQAYVTKAEASEKLIPEIQRVLAEWGGGLPG